MSPAPLSASVILVVGLAIQTAALALYLAVLDRAGARELLAGQRTAALNARRSSAGA